MRQLASGVDEFSNRAEAVEAGHVNIHEDQVGVMGLDAFERFQAVAGRPDDFDVSEGFQQESELIASQFFIVNDQGRQRRGGRCLLLFFGHRRSPARTDGGPTWPLV